MEVYILMGTHMPEMATCLDHLQELHENPAEMLVLAPDLRIEGLLENSRLEVRTYEAREAAWQWDPSSGKSFFVILDPRLTPVAQIESLAASLQYVQLEPTKVVTLVDSAATEQHARMRTFMEACVYYSDVAFMGNRSQASKSFIRQFEKDFERKCFPCLFRLLKGNGIPNDPMEILTPGTRRLSQIFDLPTREASIDSTIEASCDLDLLEEDPDPYRHGDEDTEPIAVPSVESLVVWEKESS